MKSTILLCTSLLFSHLTFSQTDKDFKWLEGQWERQNVRPGTTAYETWERESNTKFLGLGISMKGADTTFVEKLSILRKENDWFYVAEVGHNSEPTYFKITSLSKNGFVSENPNHDFPKKIEYKLDATQLTVIISAGEKEIGFVFTRVRDN